MNIRDIFRLPVACILACAINSIFPNAAAAPPDITHLLAQDKPVQSVKVLLLTPNIVETLVPLKEGDLAGMGCTYLTVDKDAINQLIGLLKNASLEQISSVDNLHINLQQAVYLDFADGSSVKFLFSREAYGGEVTGIVGSSGTNDSAFFKTGPVAGLLWKWSTQADENSNRSPMGDLCSH